MASQELGNFWVGDIASIYKVRVIHLIKLITQTSLCKVHEVCVYLFSGKPGKFDRGSGGQRCSASG